LVHDARIQLIPRNKASRRSKFGRTETAGSAIEGPGIQLYWTGEHAKEDAIRYAAARVKFKRRGEIRVLNHDGKIQTIIPLTQ